MNGISGSRRSAEWVAQSVRRGEGLMRGVPGLLVTESIAVFEDVGETFTVAGFFGSGPSGMLADDSSDQLRLLDMVGRRP